MSAPSENSTVESVETCHQPTAAPVLREHRLPLVALLDTLLHDRRDWVDDSSVSRLHSLVHPSRPRNVAA